MKSFWARRLKRRVPAVTYYSVSPAGHCPHHEAPRAVNTLLAEWIASQVRSSRLIGYLCACFACTMHSCSTLPTSGHRAKTGRPCAPSVLHRLSRNALSQAKL